jgi:murein DD-endopeptidase MepM/ murein hydrolase activator NlpD
VRLPGRDARRLTTILAAGLIGTSLAQPVQVVVKPKDTLYGLARGHATTIEEIRRLNRLDNDTLFVGQSLWLQHEAADPGARPTTTEGEYQTVTVKAGQTLYSLANSHKTTVDAISAVNRLEGDRLSIGQVVRVPHGATAQLPPSRPAIEEAPSAGREATKATSSAAASGVAQTQPYEREVVLWPLSGVITQGYSQAHQGIDIAAPQGTPIYAALSGTVVSSGWDGTGFGLLIRVLGVDGRIYMYGHNSRNVVRVGDRVQQGEVIALVGSTGNSTGPHLDFRILTNPRYALNPLAALPTSRVQLASTAARRRR